MDNLADSPIGSLVAIRGRDHRFGRDFESHAYLPDALPETMTFASTTWIAISQAMAELGRLDATAEMVPNPALVTQTATRREAIGTSALEGTFANLDDLYAIDARENSDDALPANIREVLNYTTAAERSYEWILQRQMPVSWTVLAEAQRTIVRGADAERESGALRTSQVFIGVEQRPIEEARFIPPPPGPNLGVLVSDLIDWNTRHATNSEIPLLARVALTHYQFETIHPFTDGNGRVGRLLAILQLLGSSALSSPVLSISAWLRTHDREYRDQLLDLSVTGDWDRWVQFFALAVTEAAADAHARIARLFELRDELTQAAKTALPRGRLALEIAEALTELPILSVSSAQRAFGKTNQANRSAITQLCDIGVLEPYRERRYGQLYWCPRVFHVIER